MRADRAIAACLALVLLSGCQARTTSGLSEELQPIAVPEFEETKPLAFRRIALRVPRSKRIGSIGAGVLCIQHGEINARRGRHGLDIDRFGDLFRDELEAANYLVVGDPDDLFGDPELDRAEYFVAGLITDVELNVCYPWAGYGNTVSGSASSYIEIEWQLYDTLRREVVKKVTTTGNGEVSETRHPDEVAMDDAFSMATRNLLATEEFYSTVRNEQRAPAASALPVVTNLATSNPGLESDHLAANTAVVRTSTGHGSGFLIGPDVLVTNQHVVGGSERVRLIFVDGYEAEGTVIFSDSARDLAMVRTSRPGAAGLTLATGIPTIGTPVYSYGAPLDERYSGTLRSGVVSGLREERGYTFVQADAAVNRGNSGGPLLDQQGRVLGMATRGVLFADAIEQGINYFIPVDDIRRALEPGA